MRQDYHYKVCLVNCQLSVGVFDIPARDAQIRFVPTSLSLLQLVCPSLAILPLLTFALPALTTGSNQPLARNWSNIERLALLRLNAAHEDVLKPRAQRVKLAPPPGLNDFRRIPHAFWDRSAKTVCVTSSARCESPPTSRSAEE